MLVKLITVIIHSLVDLSPWMPPVDGFVKPKLVARSIFFRFYRFHHESVIYLFPSKNGSGFRTDDVVYIRYSMYIMERSHVENGRDWNPGSGIRDSSRLQKNFRSGRQIWREMPAPSRISDGTSESWDESSRHFQFPTLS